MGMLSYCFDYFLINNKQYVSIILSFFFFKKKGIMSFCYA